jgi:hypothetical protein
MLAAIEKPTTSPLNPLHRMTGGIAVRKPLRASL